MNQNLSNYFIPSNICSQSDQNRGQEFATKPILYAIILDTGGLLLAWT